MGGGGPLVVVLFGAGQGSAPHIRIAYFEKAQASQPWLTTAQAQQPWVEEAGATQPWSNPDQNLPGV